jgi:hypothetical protein
MGSPANSRSWKNLYRGQSELATGRSGANEPNPTGREAASRGAKGKLKTGERSANEMAMARSFEVYFAREQESAQRHQDMAYPRELERGELQPNQLKERERNESGFRLVPSATQGSPFIPWILAAVSKVLLH